MSITGASRGQARPKLELFCRGSAAVVLTDVLDGGIVSKRRDKPYSVETVEELVEDQDPQRARRCCGFRASVSIKAEAGHVVANGFCGRPSGAHQRGLRLAAAGPLESGEAVPGARQWGRAE